MNAQTLGAILVVPATSSTHLDDLTVGPEVYPRGFDLTQFNPTQL